MANISLMTLLAAQMLPWLTSLFCLTERFAFICSFHIPVANIRQVDVGAVNFIAPTATYHPTQGSYQQPF